MIRSQIIMIRSQMIIINKFIVNFTLNKIILAIIIIILKIKIKINNFNNLIYLLFQNINNYQV